MRLLHLNAIGKLVLTDFRGKTIPPYAILSHRWSDSEILMEDVLSEAYTEKEEGYKKLKFCAEQAVRDELQYFWIDTCCIDKYNKIELSTAINSMFQWYKNATRCYVFLSDVSVPTAIELAQRSDWEALFRKSKWFTRGWTLQELIAPASVEFFSYKGYRIGDKASLGQLLHEITSIPLAALRNCLLDQFSISDRMRWVKNRETTEEEDIVYCLLGVLGVSMPATYGEGRESAQRRLQAEVETAGSAPSIIPFSQNEFFVGRELQLVELEAKLFSNNQTTTTLAIVGPGGIGKSQLALEVAHRTRQNRKACSIFWIDTSGIDSFHQSYISIAQKLCVSGWDDDLAGMTQLTRQCTAEMSTRQCLLIFDNVEDTTLRSSDSSTTAPVDLAECLPKSRLCSAIFTTTNSDMAWRLAPQNILLLRELTEDTALRMLQSRLLVSLSNTERQEAKELLKELLYLPLAVSQAAACMNASGMIVQEYRSQLREHEKEVLLHSSDTSAGKLLGSSIGDPIASTLFLSVKHIGRDNGFAVDCLFLAACIDRKDISLEILGTASPQTRQVAIKLLDKYALITRRPAQSALDIHQLVHQALRKQLQVQEELQQWTQRTITQLLRVFPNDEHSKRSKWRRFLPHVQYALLQNPFAYDNKSRMELARKCAMALQSDGRFKEAEELFMQVMKTSLRVLGGVHPNTLTSMAALASIYKDQGRWKEAEELQAKELGICLTVLGDEHFDTVTSIGNLALAYSKQGRWKEAEKLEIQVIEIRKRVLGDEHPFTLTSISNLAGTYWTQGQWKKAEELFIQVIKLNKRVFGDEHPNTLTSIANLASTYWNQGRWKEAEELGVEVLETSSRVLGDGHPDTLSNRANLASVYSRQGRWKEAEELFIQVIKSNKRVLGDKHPYTLTSIANLAAIYSEQGQWKEAEELSMKVMETRKRILGDEHPDTLTSMANLACTLRSQARGEEALALMKKSFQSRRQVLGLQHPHTQHSLGTLNSWRREEGKFNS